MQEKSASEMQAEQEVVTWDKIYESLCERHTKEVQDKLLAGKVAIAGLGGLGSTIAVELTRAGVGHLHLIDFDVVDISNLNRQQYRIKDIGKPKTEAIVTILKEINPYLAIETEQVKVTEENVGTLFAEDTIICEAFDKPEAKAMLVNGFFEHYGTRKTSDFEDKQQQGENSSIAGTQQQGEDSSIAGTQQQGRVSDPAENKYLVKKLVSGSGMAGYADSNLIRTRKMNSRFYLCGDNENGLETGQSLMSPRVSICASHQANQIIRLLLGEE